MSHISGNVSQRRSDLSKQFYLMLFYARRSLTYRADSIAQVVGISVDTALVIYFWSLADVTGFPTMATQVAYFMVARGCVQVNHTYNFMDVGNLSKALISGKAGGMMLLPYDLFRHIYAQTAGSRAVIFAMSVLFIVVGVIISSNPAMQIVQGLVLLAASIMIGFYSSKALSGLGFIFTEMDRIRLSIGVIVSLISGSLVPLTFFPSVLGSIFEALPTAYFAYWPAAYITGSDSGQFVRVMLIALVWIFVLKAIADWSFPRLMRRAEVVGL